MALNGEGSKSSHAEKLEKEETAGEVDEGLTQSVQECPLVYNKMGYTSKKRLFSILKIFSLSPLLI